MPYLHDCTVHTISYEWEAAKVIIILSCQDGSKTLVAEGVTDLHVPHTQEWGPSKSVNEAYGPLDIAGLKRFFIEMQSSDVIEITAKAFILPEYLEYPPPVPHSPD